MIITIAVVESAFSQVVFAWNAINTFYIKIGFFFFYACNNVVAKLIKITVSAEIKGAAAKC